VAKVLSIWKGELEKPVRMGDILREVAEKHGVTVELLRSASRRRAEVSHPRQEFMAQAFDAGFGYSRIAHYLGFDPTTVRYGVAAFRKRNQSDA